ncbi:MAG: glycerate kinase [Pseudomonadota bacterium]
MTNSIDPIAFFTQLFDAAVEAAQPEKTIRKFLPEKPRGRVTVVGGGKASAQMGKAFEEAWQEKHGLDVEGVIVTRYGYGCDCKNLEVLEAAHPVPDLAGFEGAKRLLETVSDLTEDDLVVALISGGGSALLPCPPKGLALDDEIAVNEALLASGAPISAMNTVRKHVSGIKGGRLAVAAYPAKVVSLLVSDIPGDHPQFIASGPTVADTGSREDALTIIRQYDMKLPDAVMAHIKSPNADAPLPDDASLSKSEHHIVASAAKSLEAAAELAKSFGIEAHILSDAIEGEAREAARTQAAIAKEILHRDRPFSKPVLLLSGGETTVTLKGNGKGGRNTEFLLSFALEINGEHGIHALCADTDGIDGSEDNAGAFVDGGTVARMREAGIDPVAYLQNNDAWSAFDKVGALFIPGPTGTNVNDLRAILITG